MPGETVPGHRSTLTTLLIKDLPEELNRRQTLLDHFSNFGEVTRVQCRGNCSAVVHFKHHGDALAAKNKGKRISPRFGPVSIQWCKMERLGSSDGTSPPKVHLIKDGPSSKAHIEAKADHCSSPFIKTENSSASNVPTTAIFGSMGADSPSATLFGKSTAVKSNTNTLFGKRPVENDSGAVGAALFGKALQQTTGSAEMGGLGGAVSDTLSTASFPKETALFGKPLPKTSSTKTAQDNVPTFALAPQKTSSERNDQPMFGKPTEAAVGGSNVPATETASSGLFQSATLSSGIQLAGVSGKVPSHEQDRTQSPFANSLSAANTEKSGEGFTGLAGSKTLFGKPADLATPIATTSTAPTILFGKPVVPSTVGTQPAEVTPKASLSSQTNVLFGKPVTTGPAHQKFAASSTGTSLLDKPPSEAGAAGQPLKTRPGVPPGAIPPTSAMRWSADGASGRSAGNFSLRRATADPPRRRGNIVWTKEKAAATAPKKTLALDPSKAGPSQLLGSIDHADSQATTLPPKQLGVVTRPQGRSASPSSFAELFAHAANSVGERFKVLDTKDKIIREQMSSEVQRGPIKGTCTDMCPEKERYLRSLRNLVEKFEMLPGADGVMDHTRMVKEFQRSSADQEYPLPHELRPPPVLEMTMNYLIREIIANQPTKGSGSWFAFIWNRTRAIRKDITQQKIEADPISALILERCARFHIHCSHSLCEEYSHDFDAKLNNENLTKCLKSLKYSYHDLKLQKVRCPNEAEFVAYEILLNLKEGNIAKTITDLEPHLRRHPLVKLSIVAMHALSSGNYLSFFKVVRRAPYLAACILHRYFVEIRIHALMVLAKALSKGADISLSVLSRDLYFNSERECKDFLTLVNIDVDENGLVNLKTLSVQEARFDMWMSQGIAQKLGESLAQVVYGPGEFPTIQYTPQDSFTQDGILKKSALGLPEDFKVRSLPAPTSQHLGRTVEPETPKRKLTDQDIQPAVLSILNYVVHEQVNAICRTAAAEQSASLQLLAYVTERVICDEVRCVAEEIYGQEKVADEMRKRALLSKMANDISLELVLRQSSKYLREICQEALTEVTGEVVDQLVKENHERVAERLLAEMVSLAIQEERRVAVDEHNKNLAKNFRTIHLCKRVVNRWRKWVRLQREVRDFPAAPNFGPRKQYPVALKPQAQLRAQQAQWNEMRLQMELTERRDSLPLNIQHIFNNQRIRLLVVTEASKRVCDKAKNLFRLDNTVCYRDNVPASLLGYNVVIVLSNGSVSTIDAISDLSQRLTPAPAIGVLWCCGEAVVANVEEERLEQNHQSICVPLCNLLRKLAKRVPPEVKLTRASLRDFVNRGLEYCLGRLSMVPCNHLSTAVNLYNVIVEHLASVATSLTLETVNTLDDELGWNSRAHFSVLREQIQGLELPVPDSCNRTAFVQNVQLLKKISLITTVVNMVDFKDELVLIRDIHSQQQYLLDPSLKVRYLESDLRKFEIPEFWYQRPLLQPSRPASPANLSVSSELESPTDEVDEAEYFTKKIDATVRSAREILRRSHMSSTRKSLDMQGVHGQKRPFGIADLQCEAVSKRKSDSSTNESSARTSPLKTNSMSLVPYKLSKLTKVELDVYELRRAVDTLKNKNRVLNQLKTTEVFKQQ